MARIRHFPPPAPFLKWAGGKGQLLPQILAAVEAAGTFRRYHEPFVGGGAVFFALCRAGKLGHDVRLADVNQNLIDTYVALRDDPEAVIAALATHKAAHGEAYFYQLRARSPRGPARRAARTIYLNKTCYNGLYRENSKGQFNTPFGRHKNPRILDEENLRAVSGVLSGATLRAADFETALSCVRPGDLVYLDPPYVPLSATANFTAYSRGGFGPADQDRLAARVQELADAGAKIILSNALTPDTLDLYSGLHRHRVHATRLVNSKVAGRGKVQELLATSFPLAQTPDIEPLNAASIPECAQARP